MKMGALGCEKQPGLEGQNVWEKGSAEKWVQHFTTSFLPEELCDFKLYKARDQGNRKWLKSMGEFGVGRESHSTLKAKMRAQDTFLNGNK